MDRAARDRAATASAPPRPEDLAVIAPDAGDSVLPLVLGRWGPSSRRPGRRLPRGRPMQRQRVTIARAIAPRPKFIVCDEAVSALDVSVQAQIINLLSDLRESLGVSYLFISHNLATVRHIADRVGVMYLGKVMEQAPAERIFAAPAHPYTSALLSAVPRPEPVPSPAGGHLGGEVQSATRLPSGCRFRLRCPRARAICAEQEPPLAPVAAAHVVACHFPDLSGTGAAASTTRVP